MRFLGKEIGPKERPFIIAEISCNHNGSYDEAIQLISDAKDAFADAVKIQVYTPAEMTIHCEKEHFKAGSPWNGKYLYDLYSEGATPHKWLPGLFKFAKDIRIPLFASVFGEESLKALEDVDCPAYKIASFELNDLELLRKVADCKKPVILSTGCSYIPEIDDAVNIIIYNVIVMHCVSKYPTQITEANLNLIREYRQIYGDPIGFSDHTKSYEAAQMAVALGVSIIEKHLGGPKPGLDHIFSLDKNGFSEFTTKCHEAFIATSPEQYKHNNNLYKRSLFAVKDIKAGDFFTRSNVRSIRPGLGMNANKFHNVLGCIAKVDIERGTPLMMEHINHGDE